MSDITIQQTQLKCLPYTGKFGVEKMVNCNLIYNYFFRNKKLIINSIIEIQSTCLLLSVLYSKTDP